MSFIVDVHLFQSDIFLSNKHFWEKKINHRIIKNRNLHRIVLWIIYCKFSTRNIYWVSYVCFLFYPVSSVPFYLFIQLVLSILFVYTYLFYLIFYKHNMLGNQKKNYLTVLAFFSAIPRITQSPAATIFLKHTSL